VTVTVNAAPIPQQPPVVSAGPNFQARANKDIALRGTVVFMNQARPITAVWTLTLGPAAVSFANASALSTTARFSSAGTYILRLTVSDGLFTVFDEVAVTVSTRGERKG
jgi:hypothetical protein